MRLLLPILFLFCSGIWAQVQCPPLRAGDGSDIIRNLNRRYDDFFAYKEAKERRLERINRASGEVKAWRETREVALERARQEYTRIPKDYAREEALRIKWEAEQKERAHQLELARLCEVQQRDAAGQLLKKGRQVPGLKEFDLEEY
ncbi:MAG: hypothetical protein AB7F86_13475 [Bdellovibrionales bacterium]